MFATKKFEDYINPFTLRFHKKDQEIEYKKSKDITYNTKLTLKVALLILSLMIIAITIRVIRNINNKQYDLAISGVITTVSGGLGIIVEWFTSSSIILKKYRGLFMNVWTYLSCAFYAIRFYNEPNFYPG